MKKPQSNKSTLALKSTLMNIMKTKDYSKITIKEICEKANLNRSTFYAQYNNMDELLLDVHLDFFNEMSQSLGNMPAALHNDEERFQSILGTIQYIEKHMETFLLFINNDHDYVFERHITEYYLKKYGVKNDDFNRYHIFLYHTIGSFSMVHQWIQDRCPYDASQLARLIYACSASTDFF